MPSPEQQRVSAILAFREELARLLADGTLSLDAEARARVQRRHDAELAELARVADVDLTPTAARLSIGMRIATLLGTIALSAAYALFVAAHWGSLALPLQLGLVMVPPLLLVALTHFAMTKEPTGYVASLLATVAVIAFFTNLATLGTLFNLPDSRTILLVVGGFALLLAYGYGLTLPLLAGIGLVGGWVWTLGAVPLGLWWDAGFQTTETLLLAGLLALAVPARTSCPPRFAPWWRGAGAAALVFGLLLVQQSGNLSVFSPVAPHRIENAYKVIGAVVLALLIAWSIRRDHRVVTWIASAGAVLFLFLRLVDWFWDLLPQWLFYLVVGGVALLVLLVLRRLRGPGRAPG